MLNYEDYVVVDKDGKPIKPKFKERFKKGFIATVEWIGDHEQLCAIAIPVAVGIVSFTTKSIVKQVTITRMERVKDCRCYDRSLGHYWELRRKLTNEEWVDIEHRRQNGERLADILESLKVLK